MPQQLPPMSPVTKRPHTGEKRPRKGPEKQQADHKGKLASLSRAPPRVPPPPQWTFNSSRADQRRTARSPFEDERGRENERSPAAEASLGPHDWLARCRGVSRKEEGPTER
ncbi:hypothetical protein HPB50_000613 [Hyalomma asiaticum]|uniref:Uncharacterized protein n=1 Tax=Hyalomma asiaticum TaxID=266040 RepID=A0ACB7S430_HYAAI|nr:hypothetical protein HPB50_000613 [Hyalomma asiaticum]